MALWLRGPGADVALVHHSDRGSQPGLNRSSQQCVGEMNLRIASDGCAGLGRGDSVWGGGAAVVAEARPEGGPERR
jgi:hypothetical protein